LKSILGLDLDRGFDFGGKRRFRFGEKAKTLGLGLDFEEERGISFLFGTIF